MICKNDGFLFRRTLLESRPSPRVRGGDVPNSRNENAMNRLFPALLAALALAGAGCISVKTEHEVKPISIAMTVKVQVDKEIDQSFVEEDRKPPKYMDEIRAMFDRGAIGMNRRGYVEARESLAPAEERIVAVVNANRTEKLAEIAERTGAPLSEVETRRAAKLFERLPAGVWVQAEDGSWSRK